MEEEVWSLIHNNMWILILQPSHKHIVKGKFVFKLKGEEITIITIHVNDCTITTSKPLLQAAKDVLTAKFDMQDLSKAKSVL
ncbi:uncharacterized protein ACA1_110080 [Acanthamoeba castellanii str. Neff]|uniref:Reverse transcriptase Ty1/copia-type domain-containing protein n=1 Tax=Acanthamoeba castellanii (strain ATCC 30010 / Neff) TaxID=1257118 RepID=L8HKU6_ACACF|nr:uncharacterized protein ACA1_110080 [Acanthamoeba castellanii str. Neff]ELR25006.1 hypothetical protein ACA1_110080 [Acanthamoeba castellanii str. Neff]